MKAKHLLIAALILLPGFATAADMPELQEPDSDSATPNVEEPEDSDTGKAGTAQKDKTSASETFPGVDTQPEENDEGDKWHAMGIARLQGLNKVTAKTSEIKTPLNTATKFGNLEFTVEKCLRGPENEKTENTVLMTIWDEIPGQDKKQVFHGWMFSSSPALSALEHPIYDIVLLSCDSNQPAAPKPAETPAPAKPAKAKKAKK